MRFPTHVDATDSLGHGPDCRGNSAGEPHWVRSVRRAVAPFHAEGEFGDGALRGESSCVEATTGDSADRRVRIRFRRVLDGHYPSHYFEKQLVPQKVSIGALSSVLASGVAGEVTTGPMAQLPLVLIPVYLVPLFIMLHLAALFQARRQASSEHSGGTA